MELLTLDEAVSEVVQAVDDSSTTVPHPFIFFVGAGLSVPSVPSSAQIVAHCQEVATRLNRTTPPATDAAIDRYSHWFARAYPSARQRQA
jgi:hypothetical protein